MMIVNWYKRMWQCFNIIFERLSPLGDLYIRYWLWSIFFFSGLTKAASWDMTLQLFIYEYKVPLLGPFHAAWLGTFVEIVISTMVLIGLGGRLSILILFIFNIMAVFSYPYLWTAEGATGREHHWYWGLLLLILLLHGVGKLSFDSLWQRYRRIRSFTHFSCMR